MKKVHLLSLAVLGVVSVWGARPTWAQALPPGQEAEGELAKKPPFAGLGLDLATWDQTGLYAGGGTYRNDLGFMIIPSWNIGRRFIGHGAFRSLNLSARFLFNVPLAGVDDANYNGDAPAWDQQQPCAIAQDPNLRQTNLPRCDWGRGSRRVDYSDLSLVLANPRIYVIPKAAIHVDPSFVLTLPVSAQSRLQTMILQAVAQVGVGREFWKNRIGVGYTYGFGKPFFRYSTGSIVLDQGQNSQLAYSQDVLNTGLANFYQDPGRTTLLCQFGERCRNPLLFMQHTFRGTVNFIEPLSLTVIYRISNTYFRNPQDCAEAVAFDGGPPIPACASLTPGAVSRDYWIDSQLFWATLNYQPLSWLGVSLSYITAAPLWQYAKGSPTDPNSTTVGDGSSNRSYRQGFISADANAFTSVSLGVDVSIEGLASKFLKSQ